MQPGLKKWCRVFLNCASKVLYKICHLVSTVDKDLGVNMSCYTFSQSCMIALKHSLLFTYITDAAICITLYQINTWNVTLCQRTIASYTHAHHTRAHMHVHTRTCTHTTPLVYLVSSACLQEATSCVILRDRAPRSGLRSPCCHTALQPEDTEVSLAHITRCLTHLMYLPHQTYSFLQVVSTVQEFGSKRRALEAVGIILLYFDNAKFSRSTVFAG